MRPDNDPETQPAGTGDLPLLGWVQPRACEGRMASRVGTGVRRLGASDCERIRQDGWMAQPVNALTSTAYVAAAGVLAVAVLRADTRPRMGLPYAGLLGLVGVGSVLYHGPQPRGAGLMHDLPIPATMVVAGAAPLVARRSGRAPMPGRSRSRGLRLLGFTVAAGLAYAGGRTGAPTCAPDSRLQLHGLWHVLSASALAILGGILFLPVEGCDQGCRQGRLVRDRWLPIGVGAMAAQKADCT